MKISILLTLLTSTTQAIATNRSLPNNCQHVFSQYQHQKINLNKTKGQPPFSKDWPYVNEVNNPNIKAINEVLKQNSFRTNRNLSAYTYMVGSDLMRIINNSEAPLAWLDFGLGEAQQEYLLNKSPHQPQSKLISISVAKPKDFIPFQHPEFYFYEGRRIEDYDSRTFQSFDIITDVYGPIAYSMEPHVVLNQYLKILKNSGYIAVIFQADNQWNVHNQVITLSGKKISMLEWITLRPEFSLISPPRKSISGGEHHVGAIFQVNTLESQSSIQPLHLVRAKGARPPKLIFKE